MTSILLDLTIALLMPPKHLNINKQEHRHREEATQRLPSQQVLAVHSPVESDLLWLDLPVLHINLVAAQYNGDQFTHPEKAHMH